MPEDSAKRSEESLCGDLLQPRSYPAPPPTHVQLRSTHISHVFLTDDTVWKVKRPVRLPFLDFSTLEQRRHFCEEELRLNRRLAPEVYQEVVPIVRTSAGHAVVDPGLASGGPVVDFAVKMRRLDDQASAASLLARGALTPAHLGQLARRLATFYQDAPTAPALGSLAAVTRNVEENLAELGAFVPQVLPADAFEAAAAAQRRDLERHAPRLQQRCAAGRIRDGHGDLRLEHVYYPADGQVVVIDAVEFSQRFRAADVGLDVAFLAMELDAAGRGDLASYFVYRFARESNDFGFYPLLDFYIGYRALVRAKVACLVAADPATSADKAERKRQEGQRLLALARAHAQRQGQRPVVIAVGGLTGAGKSTLAEGLARAGVGPVISSDATRKHLAGLAPTTRGPASIYTAEFTEKTYAALAARAAQVVDSGRNVILDATFRTAAERARARELAAAHDCHFLFVEATCDLATMQARLRQRAQQPSESDADEAVLSRMRTDYRPAEELRPEERFVAHTDRDQPTLIAAISSRLLSLRQESATTP
jgi:aminoglycoside phosphotransferase family enzyme/predicted kinase